MKNKQTVSFLNCFDSFAEAQNQAKRALDTTIILHMCYGSQELFAVVNKDDVRMINEALVDETLLKETPNPCSSDDGDEMCDLCDCWKKTRQMCS